MSFQRENELVYLSEGNGVGVGVGGKNSGDEFCAVFRPSELCGRLLVLVLLVLSLIFGCMRKERVKVTISRSTCLSNSQEV